MTTLIPNPSNDFTLLYNPSWGYHNCSTKIYFKSIPNPTTFQHGYYGIENSTVKGSFHLCYPANSPLYTNKIELILEGKQFVSWKEINDNIAEEKILYKQTKIIWESTNGQYEEFSNLDLPFEFPLPDNLPATITSLNVKSYGEKIAGGVAGDGTEMGHVTYSLRAEISRPNNIFKLQINQKKIIDVWFKIQRWQTLENTFDQPFKWTNYKDDIKYEVELEKTLFSCKDTINIPMKFFIRDINKIKKIFVKLRECHELKVNNKSKIIGGYVVTDSAHGCQAKKLKTSDDNEYYFIKMKLNLTRTNLGRKLNCSTNTEMIEVWHKIKIRILLEDDLEPIELEKEISILNLITEQDSSRLTEQHHTWFYQHVSKTEETFVRPKNKKTFSWPSGMKNEDKYDINTMLRKKRFSLFGGIGGWNTN